MALVSIACGATQSAVAFLRSIAAAKRRLVPVS
jgi:hypothetical protein